MIASEKTLATSKILAQSVEKLNNSKILDSCRTEKGAKKLPLASKFNSPRHDQQLKWMRSKDGELMALLSPRPPSPYKSPEDSLDADQKKKIEPLPDQSRG